MSLNNGFKKVMVPEICNITNGSLRAFQKISRMDNEIDHSEADPQALGLDIQTSHKFPISFL